MLIRPMILLCLVTGTTVPPARVSSAPLTLGQVLSAFLADSGVATRGLDWSRGDGLTVAWQTPAPVAVTEAWLTAQGYTRQRSATASVTIGADSAREMTLTPYGTPAGIQHLSLSFSYRGDFDAFDPKSAITGALQAEGMTVTPLKCDPAAEGTMFGNLVYVLKAPAKTASALHLSWNCTGTGDCRMEMALIYRRAELAKIGCAGS